MTKEVAILAEADDRLVDASNLYQSLVDEGNIDNEAALNALVLNWEATDVGIAAGMGLPREVMATAGHRLELLKKHEAVTSSSLGRAWVSFIDYMDVGASLSELDQCIQDSDDESSGELAFFRFYREPAAMMAESVAAHREGLRAAPRTMRNRYVASIIDSRMPLRQDSESE